MAALSVDNARLGKKKLVVVRDKMQRNYRYEVVAASGRGFDPKFAPELTPAQMLALGVFGGKYMTDAAGEFPALLDNMTETELKVMARLAIIGLPARQGC